MTQESHGGNIYRLAEHLGIAENEVIDFSASINPLGVPESVSSAVIENIKYIPNYPDPEAKRLSEKIAERLSVDPVSIVCGNGSTELIYLIVRALRPMRVLIPAPTFSEYERACRVCRGGVTPPVQVMNHRLEREHNFDIDADEFIGRMTGVFGSSRITRRASRSSGMAFLCNPNNPTGRLIRREDMLKIADAARELKSILVVDEAFIDFCPDASVVDQVANNPYLIVLRSLTKFYALSGLRIGYALLPASLLDAVKKTKEPWTVNTVAQIAGVASLDDEAYKTETFKIIGKEKKEMEDGFRRLGISYVPSPVNFYLLQIEKSREVSAHLRSKGILVRDCSSFSGLDSSYIRVAVKSRRDNQRLLEEVSLCLE